MTALSANVDRQEKEGKLLAYPVVASDIIYAGALCKHNAAGYLAPCAAEAGASFAGVAIEQVDNSSGSAGALSCRVNKTGAYLMSGTGFSQAAVGSPVFASDDNTVSLTQAVNEQFVGIIEEYVSSTQVRVRIDSATSKNTSDKSIVAVGEHTTVGGAAAEDITLTGVLATDFVLVTLHTVGSTPRTILTSVAAAGKITVTFSGDPSTDHVVTYLVIR